jgi:hypothetical protein
VISLNSFEISKTQSILTPWNSSMSFKKVSLLFATKRDYAGMDAEDFMLPSTRVLVCRYSCTFARLKGNSQMSFYACGISVSL